MAILVSVRVYAGAKRNEVAGYSGGVWQVKIAAPPVRGEANTELVTFLSRILGVGKSKTGIVRGHTSRSKTIAIEGLSQEEITKRLSSSVASNK